MYATNHLKFRGGKKFLSAGFKGNQGAKSGSTGFGIGVAPTLTAGQICHTVYALQGNGIDRADTAGCNGRGWRTDQMYTLDTIDRPAVVFQQNQRDEVRNMGQQSGALTAQPGIHNQNFVCYPDIARTLTERYDSSPCIDRGQNVICYGVDCRNATLDEEKTHTLQAKANGGISLNCTPSVIYRSGGYGEMTEGVGTLRANGGDNGGDLKASSLSVYDARGNGDGKTVPTLTGDHQNRVTDYTSIIVETNDE